MAATALTDRSNRREKACKTEESIYALNAVMRINIILSIVIDALRT